ncbi:MAG: hypothetical protein K6G60_07640 [Lachnospiraceae bacterium]|nr:hypothetical protein [Lachnospiraceae bacterium]
MKLIICVDDEYGILFNRRRVSRDRAVVEKIKELTVDKKLWIGEFSRQLFDEDVTVAEDMLQRAGEYDFCFVEDADVTGVMEKVKEVFLFKWNRRYPSDAGFDPENLADFRLASSEDFPGNSHEKITLERWTR